MGRLPRFLLVAGIAATAIGFFTYTNAEQDSAHELPDSSDLRGQLEVAPRRLTHTSASTVTEVKADAAIAGWVIDGVGNAIVGVSIHRLAPDQSGAEVLAETDSEGAFRFVTLPTEGEELLLRGLSVFDSTFRYGAQPKGMRVLATRRMSLRAKVMHNARAVAGVTVSLHDGSGPTGRLLMSDPDGQVQFRDLPAGNYELWAHGRELASPVTRVSRLASTAEVVELALEPAVVGMGRSLDAEGEGLRSVVSLVPDDQRYAARKVQTEEDGSFLVEGLLPGRWQVQAEADGYVTSGHRVLQVGNAPIAFKVALEKGGVAWGRAVDQHGMPVANARIVIRGEQKSTQAVETIAEDLGAAIRWVHPLATRRVLPSHHSRRFGAGRDGVRPAECGRGHCGVDIGTERGRVVHAAAEARVARVERESKGKAGRYLVLEHRGGLKTFYMHLDEIHPELQVGQQVHAGDPLASIGRTGVIRSGPHLHFAISQNHGDRTWFIDPEPILRHAVVLPEARELTGRLTTADATLAMLVDEKQESDSTASAAQRVLRTDSEGRFRREGLRAGSYRVSAYHDTLAPGVSVRVPIRHGQESKEILVRLAPGVEIYGVVRGPNGPVRDALVVAEESSSLLSRSVAKTHTDAEGRYRLRPLTGALSIRVSAPGFGEGERQLSLVGGSDSRRERHEEFELAVRDRQLEGQVLDSAGFPVRGASIRVVSGPSARGRRVVSDDYGNFIIPEVSSGSYQVAVLSMRFPTATATLNTQGSQEIRLVPGASVLYRVVDAHTRDPLAGVRVQALGPKEQRSSVVTNSEGVAEFPKLGSGTWKLRVHHDGYVLKESEIVLRPQADSRPTRSEHLAELRRGATLAGVLRDLDGNRVASAKVWVGDSSTRTDQDGHFRLVDVGTGEVQLEADHQGERGALGLALSPGDEIVTLDLRLQ